MGLPIVSAWPKSAIPVVFDTINDGRTDPYACAHGRFLDVNAQLVQGWCLECGGTLDYHSWQLSDAVLLDDVTLTAKRVTYNQIWFG